jgi:hypothetical protein
MPSGVTSIVKFFCAGVGADERKELVYTEEADAFFKHEGFAARFGFIRMEDDLSVLCGQPEDGIVRLLCGVTAEHTQQPGKCFFLDDEFHAGRILVRWFSRRAGFKWHGETCSVGGDFV